jgi:hypothetical protein
LWDRGLKGARGSRRRAIALEQCGSSSVAVSPTTRVVLHHVDGGRPALRRRTCKHRLCPDCAAVRAVKVAADIGAAVAMLRARPDISDGELRMVTLTQQDEAGGRLDDAVAMLWGAWKQLRASHMEDLKTCFAALEITYNERRDSWHPHLHVMVVAPGWIDRKGLLESWQIAHGYVVGGGQGGVDVRLMDSVKEAIKYPLKGLSDTMQKMNEDRALELMGWLRGKRLLRTYGELRKVEIVEEEDDDVEEPGDGLLVDPTTQELWAPSSQAAAAFLANFGGVELKQRSAHDAAHSLVHGTSAEIGHVKKRPGVVDVDDVVDDGRPWWVAPMELHVCAWSFQKPDIESARVQLETAWATSLGRGRPPS